LRFDSLTGCATIVNGRNQTIPIRSTPPGADGTIRGAKAVTPDLTPVRQEKYDHHVQEGRLSQRGRAARDGRRDWANYRSCLAE